MIQKLEQLATRQWNQNVQTYSTSQTVARMEGCFAYMFTNIGDTTVTVNGMVAYPSATPATSLGDSRTLAAHTLDLYAGNIDISFDAIAPGTNPNVEVVQLFYI